MIRVSTPSLDGREREYVLDCLERGRISQGRYVRRFEKDFAKLCATRYAIACSSGTAALHLSLLALGIGPGDAIIVPALTYVATANAARYCGALVEFCDIDPDTWQIDPASVERIYKVLRREYNRVVVIPVHLYDSIAPVDNLPDGLLVVEDAAQAAPGIVSEGSLGAFSFYASKIVACGEGGMVTTDDTRVAELLRLYRGQGATTPGRYVHSLVGYNYRMTDLQAALGAAQLERLPETLARRREIVSQYRRNLAPWSVTFQGGSRASGWMTAVLLPEEANRDDVARRLYTMGIETRPFFDPLPSLAPYRDSLFPVAASVAARGLCLPTHTEMSDLDVVFVCRSLMRTIREIAA